MDDTLEEYKSFSEGAASKECISDFEQAKKRLEQLLPFEADMVRESCSEQSYTLCVVIRVDAKKESS